MEIGKLKEVEVRDLWKHEQYDFSNWITKEDNIELLNEVLGLTLVDVNKEVYVGAYRCDIVAKDEASNIKIIIENQLEQSNHDHLGKLITYASGLDAEVIVWIVKKAREEHGSAIEWLNNNTVSKINFFLIELHAYRIGDSLPAPKFEVVEQPNEFIKSSKSNQNRSEDSEIQANRLNFWNQFNEVIEQRGKPFNIRKANTAHWYDVVIGVTNAHIAITLVNKDNFVGIDFYINNDKELFDRLHEQRECIEEELNLLLEWQRLDDKKASRIKHKIQGFSFQDTSNYNELMNEIIDIVIQFRKTFKKYI